MILIKCELYSNEAENKHGNEEIGDAMTTLCENFIYEVLEVIIYDVRTLSNKYSAGLIPILPWCAVEFLLHAFSVFSKQKPQGPF